MVFLNLKNSQLKVAVYTAQNLARKKSANSAIFFAAMLFLFPRIGTMPPLDFEQ
jgi:hypothetical protein